MQTDELKAEPQGFIVTGLPAVRIILQPCQSCHKQLAFLVGFLVGCVDRLHDRDFKTAVNN